MKRSPAEGASTSVLLATSDQLAGIGGRYFNDNQQANAVDRRPVDITEHVDSVASYALDVDGADRLWEIAARAVE